MSTPATSLTPLARSQRMNDVLAGPHSRAPVMAGSFAGPAVIAFRRPIWGPGQMYATNISEGGPRYTQRRYAHRR